MKRKDLLLKGAKIALGSTLAISLSELLGLEYATSAGIITLLTIQNTRKATLKLSMYRLFSFVLTMVLGSVTTALLGVHAAAFGVFLLLMVEISFLMGWADAVSTNAVFGTHLFMMAGQFSAQFMLNEVALLIIGTGLAVLMNLIMPGKEKQLRTMMTQAEDQMGELMQRLADSLRSRETLPAAVERIRETTARLDQAIETAIAHKDNTLAAHSEFYINFFMLRKNQCDTLLHICTSIHSLPAAAAVDDMIPSFLDQIASSFHLQNDVTKRLDKLDALLEQYRCRPLPSTREEFEQRATLFHCLKELEQFLNLKKEFLEKLTDEQQRLYTGAA